MKSFSISVVPALCLTSASLAFTCLDAPFSSQHLSTTPRRTARAPSLLLLAADNEEWTSDFSSFVGDDEEDILLFSSIFQTRAATDLTACQTRQLSLGQDLVLSDFVGNLGFEEVTDWEYYYENEDDPSDRKVVQPNPFDSSKPRRTRTSSGSVVRLFRGEFVGQLGGALRSQGRDSRVLVKEFSGKLALQLAKAELESIGKLQSNLLSSKSDDDGAKMGDWIQVAASRSVRTREDNANLQRLITWLGDSSFVGILGEVNLAELDGNLEPNEFYRALGVAPPPPDAVWIVYEYAGLTSLQAYSQPAEARRARLPPKRGFFGNVVAPPPLPTWDERANYILKGIVQKTIEAVASLHDNGLVHRSIGRSSVILSTNAMDKREASSPYATNVSELRVKLSDFGFSGPFKDSTNNEEFCTRARTFGLSFKKGDISLAAANFAIAEDMHALGFVVLGLMLTALAELPTPDYVMPATDEDTLQRLLGEIFDKDMEQFRDYIEAEEVWSRLVTLLDENDGEGWKFLETLLLAREKAARSKDTSQMLSLRGLLSNSLFK